MEMFFDLGLQLLTPIPFSHGQGNNKEIKIQILKFSFMIMLDWMMKVSF